MSKDEETIQCLHGFGTKEYEDGIQGPTIKLTPDAVKIDQASYPPILIVEAAMHYLQYAVEHDWPLCDLGGLEIARDLQIKDYINQIKPNEENEHAGSTD